MTGPAAIAAATVFGLLAGQLSTGIPLAIALNRHQNRRRQKLDDPATVILDEWPPDHARRLLDQWFTERRPDLHPPTNPEPR